MRMGLLMSENQEPSLRRCSRASRARFGASSCCATVSTIWRLTIDVLYLPEQLVDACLPGAGMREDAFPRRGSM